MEGSLTYKSVHDTEKEKAFKNLFLYVLVLFISNGFEKLLLHFQEK